jgi:T5SS/PEP-CTERM-associated repeat protein
MTKCRNRKKLAVLFLGAFAVAFNVLAAETTWNVRHGGDMQVETNWKNNLKPTSADLIKIGLDNDKPITLSEDLTATGGNSIFSGNFELALTNATGMANTLSLKRILLGGGGKTIRLTAGTLSFNDNFYLGDNTTAFHDDTFWVDGDKSILSGEGTKIFVGSKNYNNMLCVANGGTVIASELHVGRNQWDDTYVSTNNCFRVTGTGSTATFSSSVNFGSSGLGRIEVLDGGCLITTNLYVRHNSGYNTIPWYGGNSMRVSGAGSKIVVNGASGKGFWLGHPNAPDCSVLLQEGAVWESYGEFKIGDGATTNATFRVASGASLSHRIYSLNVGATATAVNSALEIDNGSVENPEKSVYVRGLNSHIDIRGADAKLSTVDALSFSANTKFNVEIPRQGFKDGGVPVTCKTLSLDAASVVNITLADGWDKVKSGTYRIVVAEAVNDISDSGFAVNLPSDTDDLKVTFDRTNAKQLAVKIKVRAGLRISVK